MAHRQDSAGSPRKVSVYEILSVAKHLMNWLILFVKMIPMCACLILATVILTIPTNVPILFGVSKIILSAPQRDGIVCAAFDQLIYFDRSRERGHFWKMSMSGLYGYETPSLKNATAVGFALLKRNLISIPDCLLNNSVHVVLTDVGMQLFNEIATEKEKENYKRMLDDRKQADIQREKDRKLEEKRLANEQEVQSLRTLGHEISSKKHSLQCEYDRLSWQIGAGANNIDEIVAKLRILYVQIKELEEEDKIRSARFDELYY